MGKKKKKSSSASHEDVETSKRMKSSSTSDVDTYPASSSLPRDSLTSGKMVLKRCSKSELKQKKQEKETKEIKKSIKELTKAVKQLQETILAKPDLREMVSLQEQYTQEEKDTCCFDCEEAEGNNSRTIFVKGFQKLRPRNEIKKMLSDVFSQCGDITRVFVPMECGTRVPLGFAFINFKKPEDNEKAFEFNGRTLEGSKLKVMLAKKRGEFYGYTNFSGCDRCMKARLARRRRVISGFDWEVLRT